MKTKTLVDTSDRLCSASPSNATEPLNSARPSPTRPVNASPAPPQMTARSASRRSAVVDIASERERPRRI